MDKKRSLRLGIDLNKAELVWISQLVSLRKAKKLLQEDVAARMGVDQSTVSRLENLNNGNRRANIELLSKYARAIGAYAGHIVVDAESEEGYQRLKLEIEKHAHSLIHDTVRRQDAAATYFVTDALPHNEEIILEKGFVVNLPKVTGMAGSQAHRTIYIDDVRSQEGDRNYGFAQS